MRPPWSLMLFLLLAVVLAGVPIRLPEGEARPVWEGPLELADLTWSAGASLFVVEEGDVWVISAVGTDGIRRQMRLDKPHSRSDREDFAFLARGLARELHIEVDPDHLGALPRLPPPEALSGAGERLPSSEPSTEQLTSRPLPVLPPRPSPKPSPPVPATVPVPAAVPAPTPPEPVDDKLIEVEEIEIKGVPAQVEAVPPLDVSTEQVEPVLTLDPTEEEEPALPIEELPEVSPEVRSWWRAKVLHPPLFLSLGARDRGIYLTGTSPVTTGTTAGLAVRGLSSDAVVLDVSLRWNFEQTFFIASSLIPREESGITLTLLPAVKVMPWLLVQGLAGIEHRQYSQQFTLIDSNTVPIVGGGLQLEPWSGSRLGPFVRGGASFDLTSTKLADETRREALLDPAQFFLSAGMRFSSRRDPKQQVETLGK